MNETTTIRPRKLAHVVLRVSDLQRSRAWYRQVLQAEPAFENEMLCFLSYDDEHHRIGLLALPGIQAPPPGPPTTGLEHVAFTYDTLADLLATWRRLQAAGIEPYWTINHGPTLSFYYKDPDGHRLELQYDVLRTREEVDAFFAGGAYRENFIGVTFEPSDLAARFDAGEAVESLTRRPPLPAGKTPWDMVVM